MKLGCRMFYSATFQGLEDQINLIFKRLFLDRTFRIINIETMKLGQQLFARVWYEAKEDSAQE